MLPLPGTGPGARRPERVSSTLAGLSEANEPSNAVTAPDGASPEAAGANVEPVDAGDVVPPERPPPQPIQTTTTVKKKTIRRTMTHPRYKTPQRSRRMTRLAYNSNRLGLGSTSP